MPLVLAALAALWMAAPVAAQPMIARPADLLAAYEAAACDGWRAGRVATADEWRRKRADIRARVLDMMGPMPEASAPLAPETAGRTEEAGYSRIKVIYRAADGGPVPAWLLMPKGRGPFPAVLAAHPTHESGKDSVVGLDAKPHQVYGKELAERGFVVLAPDTITAGERVMPGSQPYVTEAWDKANPGWSAMGKMLSDHMRGVDYLASLPEVRKGAIGAIGHSLGGYNAFFLAAFDERVRAAVSSCGFTPIGGASKPFAWSRESWFVHFPRLGRYLRAGMAPFDFHEVMAMAAPRALFNFSAADDSIFPDIAAIRAAAGQVGEVYGLLGARQRFVYREEKGPHGFPEAMREEAYRWLRAELER